MYQADKNGSANFSANVTFSIVLEEGDIATYDITNIAVTLPNNATKYNDQDETITEPIDLGLTYTTSGSTVSISGFINNLLYEYYTFVMKDGSTRDLPINNKEDWTAVVKWEVPSRKEIGVSYLFSVTYIDQLLLVEHVQTIAIPQYIYWSWQTSLAKLQEFVSQGEI